MPHGLILAMNIYIRWAITPYVYKQMEYGLWDTVYEKEAQTIFVPIWYVSVFDQNLDHVIPEGEGLFALMISLRNSSIKARVKSENPLELSSESKKNRWRANRYVKIKNSNLRI